MRSAGSWRSSFRLADLGPPEHGLGALDGLEHQRARRRGAEPVRALPGQQRHVAAPGHGAPHLLARRQRVEAVRAVAVLDDARRLVQLLELDLDLAVHADDELVVARGPVRRLPAGARRLDDVLEVLGDAHALPRLRLRRDIEDVREYIAPGAVSYTHLRAHETPEHLVCRLLLE